MIHSRQHFKRKTKYSQSASENLLWIKKELQPLDYYSTFDLSYPPYVIMRDVVQVTFSSSSLCLLAVGQRLTYPTLKHVLYIVYLCYVTRTPLHMRG